MTYAIINEQFEIKNLKNPIEDALEHGIMNCSYKEEYATNDLETAMEALSCYNCSIKKMRSGSTTYYILDMYYIPDENGDVYRVAELLRYQVVESLTGSVCDIFSDVDEAYFAIDAYEENDKKCGEYEVYDIVTGKYL